LHYRIKDTIHLIHLEIAHFGICLTFVNDFSHKQVGTGSKKERESGWGRRGEREEKGREGERKEGNKNLAWK